MSTQTVALDALATWPRCKVAYGCAGRAVAPYLRCAAHLTPGELETYAAGLRPGDDLDLRGVTVPPHVLSVLLDALTGPDGRPHLGRGRFDGAVLPSPFSLSGACLEGDSSFDGACFTGAACFLDARFLGHVSFRRVRFRGNASFHGARFHRHATFDEAVFAGDALFGETTWQADASLSRAVFIGAAAFDRARFGRDAWLQAARFGGAVSFRRVRVTRQARFERVRFRRDAWLGPLAAGRLGLADAVAHGTLHVSAVTRALDARGLSVRGTADFRLRHADLNLENAVFDGALSVRTVDHPFHGLTDLPHEPVVRVLSLCGTTAPGVALTDVDLSRCRFLGLARPERLRLSGCSFATAPPSRWRLPGWHARRHAVLAEDLTGSANAGLLETLYRQLASAAHECEDGRKLERDFRYCALDIRRRTERDQWRRLGLHLLWFTCGYGLRIGRTLLCLAVLATAVWFGLTLARHGATPLTPTTRHALPSPGRGADEPW
ncbi:pentapeptide repeat-containing protein [Actinomadura miaoliensis]|uniref:Pentapeptide repeat-containing protein n=1 Tax=Actinomadura miaoliensis TaxID=430685 RepID=A0ABP7W134_9ACTN